MQTLYFIGFCFLVVAIIGWALVRDDLAEFEDREQKQKYGRKEYGPKNSEPPKK